MLAIAPSIRFMNLDQTIKSIFNKYLRINGYISHVGTVHVVVQGEAILSTRLQKKGALDSQPQVIKVTSCLPMVRDSLRLLPLIKLVAVI
jgi:hypothetical protein